MGAGVSRAPDESIKMSSVLPPHNSDSVSQGQQNNSVHINKTFSLICAGTVALIIGNIWNIITSRVFEEQQLFFSSEDVRRRMDLGQYDCTSQFPIFLLSLNLFSACLCFMHCPLFYTILLNFLLAFLK